MEIKFAQYLGPSKVNPKGEMRYFLVGLDDSANFDIVKDILIDKAKTNLIEDTNAIWFRMGLFEKDGGKFIMYWDEDLGIFFISADHTEKESEWLKRLINEAIPNIEARMNENT